MLWLQTTKVKKASSDKRKTKDSDPAGPNSLLVTHVTKAMLDHRTKINLTLTKNKSMRMRKQSQMSSKNR